MSCIFRYSYFKFRRDTLLNLIPNSKSSKARFGSESMDQSSVLKQTSGYPVILDLAVSNMLIVEQPYGLLNGLPNWSHQFKPV